MDHGTVLKLRNKCNVCQAQYLSVHSCWGRDHRSKPPPIRKRARAANASSDLASAQHSFTTFLLSQPLERSILSPEPRLIRFQVCCDRLPKNPLDLFTEPAQGLLASISQLLKQGECPYRVDIITTLLEASKSTVSSPACRDRFLHLAEKMLEGHSNLYLQIKIVHQRSVLLRLQGDVTGSQRIIENCLSTLPSSPTVPEDIISLHFSQAKNYSYNFLFSEAHDEAKYATVSSLTLSDVWEQIFCVGRIMRGEGRFTDARVCFENCLNAIGIPKVKTFSIITAVADLYCELDYQDRDYHGESSEHLLSQARDMLAPEIQRLRAQGNISRGYRRLLLSSIEVEIRSGNYDTARRLLEEALSIYNSLEELDIVDRLGHVRALMASARVSTAPVDKERFWMEALRQNRVYNPLEEEVFTCGVIHLSLCIVRDTLGDFHSSWESLGRALHVFERKTPQFLIPGIGTYILDDAWNQFQSITSGCS